MYLVEDMVVGDGVVPLPVGACPALMLGIGVSGSVALGFVGLSGKVLGMFFFVS